MFVVFAELFGWAMVLEMQDLVACFQVGSFSHKLEVNDECFLTKTDVSEKFAELDHFSVLFLSFTVFLANIGCRYMTSIVRRYWCSQCSSSMLRR